MAFVAGLVAVVYWPAIFAAPTMPRWWFLAILLPIVGAVDFRKIDPLCAALFAGGMMWAATATIVGGHLRDGILAFYFLLLIGLGGAVASSLKDIGPAMLWLSVGVAISALLCLGQWLGWSPVTMVGVKPGGLFYNSAVMAETAAPLFVWAALSRRRALALVLAIPLILCQSKVAMVAAAAGVSWAFFGRRPLLLTMIVVGTAALVFAAVTALINDHWMHTADHRLTLWGAAIYSLTFLGNGLGWWYAAHPYGYEEFVHSDALQFLVEAGAGGLFLIAIPIVILMRGIEDKALGGAFAAICFEAMVSFPTHIPVTAFLFGMLAGHLSGIGARLRVAKRKRGTAGGIDVRWEASHGGFLAGVGRSAWNPFWDRPTYPADPRPYPLRRGDGASPA